MTSRFPVRAWVQVAFVAVGIVQPACTPLFVNDFEADTVGSGPLFDVPGPPANDTVTGNPGSGSIVVHSYQPIEGEQSLKLFGPVLNGAQPVVSLNAAPNANLARPVFILWEGRADADMIVDADVVAYDEEVLRIRFDQGSVQVNSLSEGTYTANTIHAVLIGLFPDSDTYSLAMTGGADIGDTLLGSLENPGSFPHAHLSLEIRLLEADYFDAYTLDNVMISRFDADAAGEGTVRFAAKEVPEKYRSLMADMGVEVLRKQPDSETVREVLAVVERWGDVSHLRELERIAGDQRLRRVEIQKLEETIDAMRRRLGG